jgi:hypothetical protein
VPKLFRDHVQSQGKVLPEVAEPVTVASSFRGKPTVATQTLDSGANSFLSNWTTGLADFHLETDVPEEVLPYYSPRPGQEIPLQTSESPSSWASVEATSVRQPRKDQGLKTSPHTPTSPTSLQNIILQLQNRLDRLETQLEEQKQARSQQAPTESPQRDTPTPPPAPEPQTAQLVSILHRVVERMDHLEAKMEATKDIVPAESPSAELLVKMEVQSQQTAALTLLLQKIKTQTISVPTLRKRPNQTPPLCHPRRLPVRTTFAPWKAQWTRT